MQISDLTDATDLFHEGCQYLQSGDFSLSEACFRRCIEISPELAEAHANLGFLLDQRADFRAAEACYRTSLSINLHCPEVHLNLGALLATQKRFTEAAAAYALAIEYRPESSAAWSNLGALYMGMKRDSDALHCLLKAREIDPANTKAHFNLSYLFLRQGNFEEGFRSLEARDWHNPMRNFFTCPRWVGEPLEGKSLLVCYEGGHGDVIQFCRYVALLKMRGAARISLVCHPALKTLLQSLHGVEEVLGFDEEISKSGWDYWMPLMSAPYLCQTRQNAIPHQIPYLAASEELIEKWGQQIPKNETFRVGLAWKGNPQFENDADRSIHHLEILAPLWQVPNITFVSLQKDVQELDAVSRKLNLALLDPGSQMTDFADAAAIISNLDLVISVDTAIAHLAGALGKPCWVLLPDYMTDWRWLSTGSQSAWYPDVMRLFRQQSEREWAPVISQVAAELAALRSI